MIYEIIGWSGTIAILLAYLFVSSGRLTSNSKEYQLLNLIGAVGIIVNSSIHGAIPSVGLNVIWLLISIYGLGKIVRKK